MQEAISNSGLSFVLSRLTDKQALSLQAVKEKAGQLLDRNPRFKYFTLHGPAHLDSLFEILKLLINGGIILTQEDLYILSLAICTHDLGMVVTLADKSGIELLDGKPQDSDPALLEEFVRRTHHNLVELYYQNDFNFLTSLDITPQTIGIVREVSRMHRQISLMDRPLQLRNLGALLRVIDELDLSPSRAPYTVLEALFAELDATTCWHWYKHNIVESWSEAYNVQYSIINGKKSIQFSLQVHPATEGSIPYWLKEIRRPIHKALDDDGAAKIIADQYGVTIELKTDADQSYKNNFGVRWQEIEDRALSSGRKLILVVDDEHRKIEDLFTPLMDRCHVSFSHNAKDAFEKLAAKQANLAIIDMQVPGGGMFTSTETGDFKSTGLHIAKEVRRLYPETKVIILTGTKHPLPGADDAQPDAFLRKPISVSNLKKAVEKCLEGN